MHKSSDLIAWAALAGVLIAGAGCRASLQNTAVDHYVRGQLLADNGNYEAALAELRKAVLADPTLSTAHSAAGDIHRKQGNFEMARRDYEAACEINRYSFRPHYNLGVVYQALCEAAASADQAGQYLQQAVKVYLRAVTIRPDDFDANLNLSACYFQQSKYDLAEQYCKSAIEVRPNSAAAYSNLGIICDAQGRLYDAIAAYKQSLEFDVHQGATLVNLGSTYMRQGRLKQAIHTFELAAVEMPNDPAPWEQIGSCHYHLYRSADGQTDPAQIEEALKAYQKAIACNGKSPVAWRGIGVVHMTRFVEDAGKTEFRDQALQAWDRSLELKSDQADLRHLVEKYRPKITPQPM